MTAHSLLATRAIKNVEINENPSLGVALGPVVSPVRVIFPDRLPVGTLGLADFVL
jgi:hypothetical protein